MKNITSLRAEVMEKNNLIVEFTTVATTQAKHLAVMSASSHGFPNSACLSRSPATAAPGTVSDLTVPWFGSTITGVPEPEAASALPEDPWLLLGAKPKSTTGSTPSPAPAKVQVYAGGEVEAPVSSTPCQPELWSVACRDKHRAMPSSPPSSPPAIPLSNRFDVLSKKDFPPLGELAPEQQAVKPSSARCKLLKEAVLRRSSGGYNNSEAAGPPAAGKGCFFGSTADRSHAEACLQGFGALFDFGRFTEISLTSRLPWTRWAG
ncbi:uncharacterized protein LOC121521383 [Cheilinus undulatus]|uniref:uncharacterized protein LOC121521383 n=1 Tax=Cheilinus undulatus TaxID=241271 RepID=UPI001BD4D356|nr:uncharacterized protein LOC121521383 [Cheilinus undulatus]